MCLRHQIMLTSSLLVQSVEVYPLDIPSISTTTKSITDPKKPPKRHNRDTMDRITIYNRMVIRPVGLEIYTNFGFSIYNKSDVATCVPQ